MDKVTWIFFDIGSTLADESKCYKKRFEEMTAGTNISPAEFENATIDFAKRNLKGDHAAATFYGFPLSKWHKELEEPYPNAHRVLSTLAARGYKLGVIANQSPGTAARLAQWGLLQYIDIVIASAEEGVSKPDAAIFELALQRTNCTPCEAAMVGDRLDNDIAPAKKIGMTTVRVKQGYGAYASPTAVIEEADYTINSVVEMLEIFPPKE